MLFHELKKHGIDITENTPVLLHFWDKDCPACIEEMPKTIELYEQWKNRVLFVGVCMNKDGLDFNTIQQYNILWPQINLSWGHPLVEKLGIEHIPNITLLDNQERIAVFDLSSQIKTVINNLHSARPLTTEELPVATITPAKKIEVKSAGLKGAGVFATDYITINEIIEVCHVIDVPKSSLRDYVFLWQDRFGSKTVIPLGCGCIYNHSNQPNATWRQHPTAKAMEFIAIRDILPGEEICTYYGPEEYWQEKGIIPIP